MVLSFQKTTSWSISITEKKKKKDSDENIYCETVDIICALVRTTRQTHKKKLICLFVNQVKDPLSLKV